MRTIITEQLISHDIDGLPKGMLVTQATYNGAAFVSSDTIGFTVLQTNQLATIEASKTQLEQEKAALQNQLTTKTTEATALTAQLATLQAQLTSLPSLQSQLADALALVEEYRPYDPNKIKTKALYDRITGDERFALGVLAMTDDNAKSVLALLNYYLQNPTWEAVLDDPQVVGGIQYLQSVGMLTGNRVAELLRPASREEAYTA